MNNNLTPKDLMISRYEAFKKEDWKYIAQTSIHQTQNELQNSPSLQWLRLEVLDFHDNTVEFKAYYKAESSIDVLHEKSTFVKVDNQWKYESGVLYKAEIQRNELCPCGSKKKFKKCCKT